jgi:hypothetical protein
MSSLQWWSVIDVALLIAGLAVYLFIVGSQLKKVAANLEADGVNRPAMGTRRTRMIEAMGVDID